MRRVLVTQSTLVKFPSKIFFEPKLRIINRSLPTSVINAFPRVRDGHQIMFNFENSSDFSERYEKMSETRRSWAKSSKGFMKSWNPQTPIPSLWPDVMELHLVMPFSVQEMMSSHCSVDLYLNACEYVFFLGHTLTVFLSPSLRVCLSAALLGG